MLKQKCFIATEIRTVAFAVCLCLSCALCICPTAIAQTIEERLLAEPSAVLAAAARSEGDPARGAGVFHRSTMTCSACHSVGERPDSLGPDLTKLDQQTTDAALVESILQPSKTIAPKYATVSVETTDGLIFTGLPVDETATRLVLCDASQLDKPITIEKRQIVDRQVAKQSLMPTGQVNLLTERRQFLDLVRYLIDLRDGGAERARQLQPTMPSDVSRVPDEPLAWQPVVQRGDVAVEGKVRFPRALALGFVDDTVLFDADQLGMAAMWFGGFVKSSPQNYFGLYWHRQGGPPEIVSLPPHPLRFKLSAQEKWRSFEPPPQSDPNTGSRFDGYQIGKTAVRLRYRVLIDDQRIGVVEDVRVESRSAWQGFARQFQFAKLPAGAQVGLALPAGDQYQFHKADGNKTANVDPTKQTPLLTFRVAKDPWAARLRFTDSTAWVASGSADKSAWSPSAVAGQAGPLVLRIDLWKYRGPNATPSAAELASLESHPPVVDDAFDLPAKPLTPPAAPITESKETRLSVVNRPAINARENVDEFSPAKGRFLRFVVLRTNDSTAPGLDELELYGADPKVNLALAGKASASSLVPGYAIHQFAHLNDGQLGNAHSWVGAENGRGSVQIEFPEAVEMRKIVWARDRTGLCKDRLAVAYRIEVSQDGKHWEKVGDESGRAAASGSSPAIRPNASPGYLMETIPSPFPTCRPSDIAFSADGTMYAIAMTEGQVWQTRTPPVGHPERVRWQRLAAGLNHPIGLAVVDGRVFVAQKPEITELIDRDGDGTADDYRTVATGWSLSTGWHEYTFGLAVDPHKNLWFALNTGNFWTHPGLVNLGRWRGSVMRVAYGTEQLEAIASGCRTPNGIAQGPHGAIFYTDNQGDWVQACKLAHVVPGRFYGHPETKENAIPQGTYPDGRSAIWLPYDRSRSTSGPVCDQTAGKFGPFAEQMFVGDVGYGANGGIMRIALEKVGGEYQGACFRFVDGQPLGCERMKFGPDDCLYMASLTSGLTRMAFGGITPLAIQSLRIRPQGQGFVVQLTKPLAEIAKLDPADFRVKRYHYLYTGKYGSPKANESSVPVQDVQLSANRSVITLTLPVATHPLGMVYEFNFVKLTAADGEVLKHNDAWYTVQKISE